ncbi:Energy-coupling factor transporter transmembrane protein EcfT [uncultured archaeon]|nr:Energy-coupling factor transporter transmembrane protein EcfT [uncultured archaeon]
MIEWLTRDPLNGLVVTITFFISLILGRYLGQKRTRAGFKRFMIDPRIKLLISFLLIISITLMNHWYFPVVITILCAVIALKLRIFRDYSKKLTFPLVLALFIFALQGFTYGVNKIDLGIISIYTEGIEYGFLIFTRVFASASILILLVVTTSENELLENMRWFRFPGTMIEISSFMARYIKTFSNEGRRLKLAQESRCGFSRDLGFTGRMYNTASLCGALIIRAFARSERVYKAMLSRAWHPQLRYSHILPLNRNDAVLGIILSFGIIGLVVFDRVL